MASRLETVRVSCVLCVQSVIPFSPLRSSGVTLSDTQLIAGQCSSAEPQTIRSMSLPFYYLSCRRYVHCSAMCTMHCTSTTAHFYSLALILHQHTNKQAQLTASHRCPAECATCCIDSIKRPCSLHCSLHCSHCSTCATGLPILDQPHDPHGSAVSPLRIRSSTLIAPHHASAGSVGG